MPTLQSRFRGCLIGLAAADALGGQFEAQSPQAILARYSTPDALIGHPRDELWYTDDTQMAIAVAETLVEHGGISEEPLCSHFVANYVPSRGYGRGARAVLEAMEDGRDWRSAAEEYFPGGSFGNGAAMRVAPVGLAFRGDRRRVLDESRLSALPTHLHPLGIEGAQLLALAVAWACRADTFDHAAFFAEIRSACVSDDYRDKIEQAARAQFPDGLARLGNGIRAIESVPTALACFAMHPNSYAEAIAQAIFLGGDTDTIACMTGAISGAFLGFEAIPRRLEAKLENSPKGRVYILELADRLLERFPNG